MLLTYSQVLYHRFFSVYILLVVFNFYNVNFSPLLPFRLEQLYELWLDIINLCLPFNFDYDMIFLNL